MHGDENKTGFFQKPEKLASFSALSGLVIAYGALSVFTAYSCLPEKSEPADKRRWALTVTMVNSAVIIDILMKASMNPFALAAAPQQLLVPLFVSAGSKILALGWDAVSTMVERREMARQEPEPPAAKTLKIKRIKTPQPQLSPDDQFKSLVKEVGDKKGALLSQSKGLNYKNFSALFTEKWLSEKFRSSPDKKELQVLFIIIHARHQDLSSLKQYYQQRNEFIKWVHEEEIIQAAAKACSSDYLKGTCILAKPKPVVVLPVSAKAESEADLKPPIKQKAECRPHKVNKNKVVVPISIPDVAAESLSGIDPVQALVRYQLILRHDMVGSITSSEIAEIKSCFGRDRPLADKNAKFDLACAFYASEKGRSLAGAKEELAGTLLNIIKG